MKYFAVSDIHAFYDALISCLSEAGYEKDNPDHTLIVNGDIFDRGKKPIEVYSYLSSIPSNNIILIKGNHEDLYLELLDKDIPDVYDYSNGTVNTFLDIARIEHFYDWHNIDPFRDYDYEFIAFLKTHNTTWEEVKEKVKNHEITSFIKSDRWVNYYELDKYIFTHGFIPFESGDFRVVTDEEWWKDCHFEYAIEYMNVINNWYPDSIFVVGHLHSCFYHERFDVLKGRNNNTIFHNKNLYVIDTNVVRSGRIEVLTIDENLNASYKYFEYKKNK